MLRNVDHAWIAYLNEKINETWKNGSVTQQWKTANVVQIPEPGKAPNVDNLRLISLTSCDAMKMVKHQLIDGSTRETGALLGLDLEKAFDNALHEYILACVADLELGPRLYNYIRYFLTGRKAKLRIGDFVSDEVLLGPWGTPQGSVISPAA
ncbi:uncharacterized protein [Dermacentor albipictus]|uniref:uncharacterized protein n=1 Tax=Dermacentor albipictus TaxID=60249 RepID=UPI0038FC634F